MTATPVLRVENLVKHYGGVQAVRGVSFQVPEASIVGLIGPNGAGKTTTFNCIAGAEKPTDGRVYLYGDDITGVPTYRLYDRALLRTFQLCQEYRKLTALENLMVAASDQPGERIFMNWLSRGVVQAREAEVLDRADEVLEFLTISHLAEERAGNLSGGQKKLLELGRTMMVDAKMVFLDEVGAGVNRTLLYTIGDAIKRLNVERGYTFCMIEHDMDFIKQLCDPVIVMAQGSVMATGTADEIMSNEAVIEAYLGTGVKNKKKEGAE